MSVKVTAFFEEKDPNKINAGNLGAVLFQIDRGATDEEGQRPVEIESSYKGKDGKWNSFTVATCWGVVDARGRVRIGKNGEYLQTDVKLTREEKDEILNQAARIQQMQQERAARQPARRFGYQGEPAGAGNGRPPAR